MQVSRKGAQNYSDLSEIHGSFPKFLGRMDEMDRFNQFVFLIFLYTNRIIRRIIISDFLVTRLIAKPNAA